MISNMYPLTLLERSNHIRNIKKYTYSTMTGKVYFITGTNRGIGFELTKQFASDPSNVVISTVRDISKSEALNELASTSSNIKVVSLDVGDPESVSQLSAQLSKAAPNGIDTFISNAVFADKESYQPVLDVKRDTWLKYYTVNTLGPIETLKVVKPFLDKKDTKKVILISSEGGSLNSFYPISNSPYGNTKAALNFIAKTLAFELKPEGYTTVAIHPGAVRTKTGNEAFGILVEKNPQLAEFNIHRFEPEAAGKALAKLFDGLTVEDNDKFLNHDGTEHAW